MHFPLSFPTFNFTYVIPTEHPRPNDPKPLERTYSMPLEILRESPPQNARSTTPLISRVTAARTKTPSFEADEPAHPIHRFLKRGEYEFVRDFIYQNSHDIDTWMIDEMNLLEWAFEENEKMAAKYIVHALDADVNFLYGVGIPDEEKKTLLHKASEEGNTENARFLVEDLYANVHYTDLFGRTPLHYACMNSQSKMVRFLYTLGAEVNAKDNNGFTPLHFASMCGTVPSIEALIDLEAQVDPCDNYGLTPLYYACKNGHLDAVKTLVRLKAKIDAKDQHGQTLLHSACRHNFKKMAHFLVKDLKANVNCADNRGHTPLHNAVSREKNLEMCRFLIETLGADVNCQCHSKRTPLIHAVRTGERQTAHFLIEDCRANVFLSDKSGNTALHYIEECSLSEEDQCETARIILESALRKVVNENLNAREIGGQECLKTAFLALLNAQNRKGNTPLLIAAKNKRKKLKNLLLFYGASPIIRNDKEEYLPPRHPNDTFTPEICNPDALVYPSLSDEENETATQ